MGKKSQGLAVPPMYILAHFYFLLVIFTDGQDTFQPFIFFQFVHL